MLSTCGAVGAHGDGRRCHGLDVKVGLDENQFVENALLGMYTKCGSIGEAVRLFDGMARPNEVSFTAMMGGLAQTGTPGPSTTHSGCSQGCAGAGFALIQWLSPVYLARATWNTLLSGYCQEELH